MANLLSFLQQTKSNLIAQRQMLVDGYLHDRASFNNDIAVPVGLPDSNEQYINRMEIVAELYGVDTLSSYYNSIFYIAQQCPYAGGPAVYRARAFIAMLNDTVEYDDSMACLLEGIYRKASAVKEDVKDKILIIPNPANDYIKIILNDVSSNICRLSIFNSLGAELITKTLDCKQKEYVMNISNLSQGAYYIKVNQDDAPAYGKKLILIR